MSESEQKVVQVAEAILSGTIGIIEGSRRLVTLRQLVTKEDFDKDFKIFVLIDSDSDHIPIGDARKQWAPQARKDKDKELEQIENWYRDSAEQGCKILIARFKAENDPTMGSRVPSTRCRVP